jgi:hypothetical protein
MQIARPHSILAPAVAIFISCSVPAQSSPAIIDSAPAPSSITAARGTPQREAAEHALRNLADRLAANEDRTGIDRVMAVRSYSELRHATLGDGFEVNLIDPAQLLAGEPIDACIHGTGQWRFIVLAEGKPVGLLTVTHMHDGWKRVEVGASELAKEVATVEARYARQTPAPGLRFVRSLQAVADFIEVSPAPVSGQPVKAQYIPLRSARVSLGNPRADASATAAAAAPPLAEPEMAAFLRARVRSGMRDLRYMH